MRWATTAVQFAFDRRSRHLLLRIKIMPFTACRRLAATASAVGTIGLDCAGAAAGVAIGVGVFAALVAKDVFQARPCRNPSPYVTSSPH